MVLLSHGGKNARGDGFCGSPLPSAQPTGLNPELSHWSRPLLGARAVFPCIQADLNPPLLGGLCASETRGRGAAPEAPDDHVMTLAAHSYEERV